jgi:hypothetical protein
MAVDLCPSLFAIVLYPSYLPKEIVMSRGRDLVTSESFCVLGRGCGVVRETVKGHALLRHQLA